MAIGDRYKTKLTAAGLRTANQCLEHLHDAAQQLVAAATALADVPGLERQKEKLASSAEALVHERRMVGERITELLDRGKVTGGCPKCGCAFIPGSTSCDYCFTPRKETS